MKNDETALSEREKILARVREALKTPVPPARFAGHQRLSTPRQWLPKVGEGFDEQLPCLPKTPPG